MSCVKERNGIRLPCEGIRNVKSQRSAESSSRKRKQVPMDNDSQEQLIALFLKQSSRILADIRPQFMQTHGYRLSGMVEVLRWYPGSTD
nr:hypothetical protein Iba_chr08fCG0930 [Ipomoea batatas]